MRTNDWLYTSARAYPDRIALIYESQSWTYSALNQEADRLCAWLIEQSIVAGQHIGVLMHNSPAYVLTIHALIRLGMVLVPLNTRLTQPELSYAVEKADCTFIIAETETIETASTLPVHAVQVPDIGLLPDSDSSRVRELDLDETHALVFTSGTSGRPKGAVLSYSNHFYSATASAFRLGMLPGDRWLCSLPLYHVGGLAIILRSALYGTAVVLHSRFDLDAVTRSLKTDSVTLISLVPTMLQRLLAHLDDAEPSQLRLVLLGGAATTIELVEAAQARGIAVATTYGLSEAASQVATQTPDSTREKPGSVGKAVPFTQVQILNDAGREQAVGEYGEVVVTGPTVMQGYYKDAESSARTLRDGQLHTGDIGYIDADGDLWLVQRRSDLIVSGGENVYPAEVEAVIRQHPAVEEVCVVGVAHVEWGQQVAAAVQLRKDADPLSADALEIYIRDHLAGYKVPRVVRFVETLPLTASGKIARTAVKGMFERHA